ncbi:MAG: dephospho-CoA kinase [Pseudomonadota bacterium]
MIVLGLTGSIGMGKSTTAGFFRDAGIPVWDADAAVHRLYARGGAGVAAIGGLIPDAVIDGAVDRSRLRGAIVKNAALLARVEALIHPLVAQDRAAFLERERAAGAALVLCDIPLLFEVGGAAGVDKIVVVTAPPDVQRARVLARPGMTDADLDAILARQMPDAEKRRKADFIIDTANGCGSAREAVAALIARLRKGQAHA